MAEFLGQKKLKRLDVGNDKGFNAIGKPIPFENRANADKHCKDMGLTDAEERITVINLVASHLERDNPYEALKDATKYLDLTGSYRLMAALLT